MANLANSNKALYFTNHVHLKIIKKWMSLSHAYLNKRGTDDEEAYGDLRSQHFF